MALFVRSTAFAVAQDASCIVHSSMNEDQHKSQLDYDRNHTLLVSRQTYLTPFAKVVIFRYQPFFGISMQREKR